MSDLISYHDRPPAHAAPLGSWPNAAGSRGEDAPGDETIDLRQLLSTLRQRVWLIAAMAIIALAGTAFVVLRQAPKYRAAAAIRLYDERQAVAGGIAGAALDQAMGRSSELLYSQLQVLRSRTLASAVVDRLGLRLRPVNGGLRYGLLQQVIVPEGTPGDTLSFEFEPGEYQVRSGVGAPARAPYGVGVQVEGVQVMVPEPPGADAAQFVVRSQGEAVDWLLASLRAVPRERTNVVDVDFTADDPVLAQRVVNAVVEEFRAASVREAQQQASRRRVFVEAQLAQTDSVLAEAQAGLMAFQRREEVYSLEQKFMAQQSGQLTLDIRREELASDLGMLRTLLKRLEGAARPDSALNTLISAPTVAQNPLVSQLSSQLAGYETELASLTTGSWGLAEGHPDVQRLSKLVAETRTRLVDAVASHVMALEARLNALDQLRARSALALKALPETGAEEARLRQQVQTIHKMADQLREEYQRARIAEAVEVGQVAILDAALAPGAQLDDHRGMKLGLGLLTGLLLGAGLAFLLEQMNTTIRGREDLEAALGVPGLAVIPHFDLPGAAAQAAGWAPRLRRLLGAGQGGAGANRGSGNGGGVELVTMTDQRFGGSEAYRVLRTNLLFSRAGQRLHTLVVASAVPSEGKTTTTANLAVTFAQQGMRVLLVDCDLRRARAHNLFNLGREPGLTQMLIGAADAAKAIRTTDVEGLYVLPAGALPPNPAELLGSREMQELVERLKGEFELVIFDTAPVLVAADAAVLAKQVDGTVLVVRAGATDRGASQQALHQLRLVGARVLGAVLNDPDTSIKASGDRYSYYSYKYYGEEAEG